MERHPQSRRGSGATISRENFRQGRFEVSPLHVHQVTYPNGKQAITAYAARPQGEGPSPAVIVLPPIAGVGDYIRDITVRLAAEGLMGFAIDTFSREGKGPDVSSPEKVAAALADLPDPRVLSDVRAALDYLRADAMVRSEQIGVLGFCIGGTHALLSACEMSEFKAAVIFYGLLKYPRISENQPHSPIDRVPELSAPILGHYGTLDRFVSADDLKDFEDRLNQSQKSYELYTYRGAPHAFHEDLRPAVYRPVAAASAWRRTLTFLHWHLQGQR